jgi:hypothetical protein
MVPAHIWELMRPYGIAPKDSELPRVADKVKEESASF